MPFTVLSDSTIRSLLHSLTPTTLSHLYETLSSALTTYSLHAESQYQPHRVAVTRPPTNSTTLFMPSTSPTAVGTKIISVPPADAPPTKALSGVLVLCDAEGQPNAILNAAEVTAFRTALGSMLLLPRRKRVANVVVFGAGKQAAWHVRLALLLKGEEVRKVTVVNRSRERTEALVGQLREEGKGRWDGVEIGGFEGGGGEEYEERLVKLVDEADVIFCTTPVKSPLFPGKYLFENGASKGGKGRYVTAIGSYKTDMMELDPELFRDYVGSNVGVHPKGKSGSAIVVDTLEGCFQESGEIVHGGVKEEQVVEVGELLDILKSKDGKENESLSNWVEEGFVIYKSVGVGIMDLAVGSALVDLAREKGEGVTVPEL